MRSFSLNEVFGFEVDEFPTPEQMPNLSWLWLTSIPAEAGKQIKKLYSKVPNIDLNINKLRNAKWLTENLNNPFRHWDGEAHITSAHVKKAAKEFITFSRGIDALRGKETAGILKSLKELTLNYTMAFNLMDKKGWIETTERENIAEILFNLLEEAKKLSPDTIDKKTLFEIFDRTRDF